MAERPSEPGRPPRRRRVRPATAVGIYVLVLLVLQIFLLSVALDGFHSYDAGLAWGAAVTSTVLWASVMILERLLGRL